MTLRDCRWLFLMLCVLLTQVSCVRYNGALPTFPVGAQPRAHAVEFELCALTGLCSVGADRMKEAR